MEALLCLHHTGVIADCLEVQDIHFPRVVAVSSLAQEFISANTTTTNNNNQPRR